ncbi:MAG: universal stress protein [Acidimicrobiales bacterium]
MFDKLLLAIDDSPGSEVAVIFATALAQRCSASVHVLCVNELQVSGRGLTLLTKEESLALVGDAVLGLQAVGVRASASVQVASYRHVARRIAETAHERGVDAIVLGSERHRRTGRLFSSGVRARTTRLTSLPILIAPAPLQVGARMHLDADVPFFQALGVSGPSDVPSQEVSEPLVGAPAEGESRQSTRRNRHL